MKVLLVNTYDTDGGAARVMYRLMGALQKREVQTQLLCQRKDSDNPNVIGPEGSWKKGLALARGPLDKLPLRKYPNRNGPFSPNIVPDRIPKKIEELAPDVVHLGWLQTGFARIESLPKIKRPVVITANDMWLYTGGCHYTGECTAYERQCGSCPVLGSDRENDLSRKVYRRKLNAWKNWDFITIAISQWEAETARRSSLLAGREIRVIPPCLDTEVFAPTPKAEARRILNLPMDHDILLFGAVAATSNRIKGYDLVLEALKHLKEAGTPRPLLLVVFGSSGHSGNSELPFPVRFLGNLHDDVALRIAYSAADVMTVPSRQEAFGQTTSESLACGTPVVGFRATGMLDTVAHGQCGYLAEPFDPKDLARGYMQIFLSKTGEGELPKYESLSEASRARALAHWSHDRISGMYIDAYQAAIEKYRLKNSGRSKANFQQ